MNYRQHEIINELLEGLRNRLRSQWREYRKQSYNPNSKGAAYEKALANLLRDYVGGTYDIRTRTAVIDDSLECFNIFSPSENEIDVVAIFPQSKPQVVFEADNLSWIPYHGVAFICEVKSALTTTALRDDLAKTGKLAEIEREDGFGVTIGGSTTVNYQLKCLVYDEVKSVSIDTIYDILEQNIDAWDLLLLVERNELIANPKLPFSETAGKPLYCHKNTDAGLVHVHNGLLWFLAYISVSIDYPPSISTVTPLLEMIHREAFFSQFDEEILSLVSQLEEGDLSELEEGEELTKDRLKELLNSQLDDSNNEN